MSKVSKIETRGKCMVFFLVLIMTQGMVTIPEPFKTLESCEIEARKFEAKGNFNWPKRSHCVSVKKG